MRLLKQAMAILGSVVMIAVLVALVAPKSVHAVVATLVQIVPSGTTHVLQNESQIVLLYNNAGDFFFQAVDASGVHSGVSYTVPAGYTLIITDYEWEGYFGPSQAGLIKCDGIMVQGTPNGVTPGAICSTSPVDVEGYVTSNEHYTTGFRVASGLGIYDGIGSEDIGSAAVQGYLVPN